MRTLHQRPAPRSMMLGPAHGTGMIVETAAFVSVGLLAWWLSCARGRARAHSTFRRASFSARLR